MTRPTSTRQQEQGLEQELEQEQAATSAEDTRVRRRTTSTASAAPVVQPIADWWRPRRPRKGFRTGARRHAPRRPRVSQARFQVEPLEPRFLLNGELSSLAGAGAFGDMAFDAADGFLAFGSKLDEIIATLDEDFAGLPGMLTTNYTVENGEVVDSQTRPPKIADLLSHSSVNSDGSELLPLGSGLSEVEFDYATYDRDSDSDQVNLKTYLEQLAERANYLADDPDTDTELSTLDLNQDGMASWREAFDVLFVGHFLSVLDDFANGSNADIDSDGEVTAALNDRVGKLDNADYSSLIEVSDQFDFVANDSADDYNLSFTGSVSFGFVNIFDLDFGIIADQLGIQALTERFTSGNSLTPTATSAQPTIELAAYLDIPLEFSFAFPEVGDTVGDQPGDDLTQDEYNAYYDSFGLRAGTFVGDGNDPIQMTLSSSQDLTGLFVNAGFLGLQVTEGGFTLTIDQGIEITPASLPSTLGFGPDPLDNTKYSSSGGVLTAANPLPTELFYPVEFELSFQLDAWQTENDGPTTPVTVMVEPPEGDDILQDAVEAALVDSGLDDLLVVTVVEIGGEDHLQFSLNESSNSAQLVLTPDSTNRIEMTLEDSWFSSGDFSAAFLLGAGTNVSQLHRVSATGSDREAFLTGLNAALPAGVTATAVTTMEDDGNGNMVEVYTGEVRIIGPVDQPLYLVNEFSLDADGVVRLDELINANTGDLFNLTAANDDDASFAFDLTLDVIEGLERTTGNWDTIKIAFGSGDADESDFNIFDLTGASLTDDINGFTRLDYSTEMDASHRDLLENGLSQEVVDFNQVGANSVIGMLGQLRAWADRVADSAYLSNLDVPFADLVLGEVLGFDALVQETLLFDEIGEEAGNSLSQISRLIAQVKIGENVETLLPFTNVQELANRLDALGLLDATDYDGDDTDEAVIWYDPVDVDAHDPDNPKLLVPLTLSRLSDRVSLAESPVDFLNRLSEEEGGATSLLGPLELTFSASTIEVSVEESMNVTLGILLGEGGNLDNNPDLDELGVTPMDDLAVTGGEEVQAVYGRLSADASFDIRVTADGEDSGWETITIAADNQNTKAQHLADDINSALASNSNISGITAEVLNNRIILVAADTVSSFDVDVSQTNTAYMSGPV